MLATKYAVLHDPAYRHDCAVDLLREFPRLPLYNDWGKWVEMGRELLALHIGFEDVEPYPLERVDKVGPSTGSRRTDSSPRVMLRANARDKEQREIQIDSETVLREVPADAWPYMLWNRSALEWVMDRFNTYRFADYKEDVIELLCRVCTVSVRTMGVVDEIAANRDNTSSDQI